MQPSIRLCNSNEIDPEKWDICVAKNANGLIYAQYHYLNTLCHNWAAIIIGSYEAIMPLPWNSKWGIKYYQAIPFIQQLGLIGKIDNDQVSKLMELIYDFAKYGDLFFNFSNHELTLSVPTKAKTNLVLDLHQDYTTIANNYKKDLCNNLDKANKYHPVYSATNHYSIALNIYQKQYGNRFHWVSKRDYGQLARLLSFYQSKSQCLVRELKDPTTEDLLSSTILLKDEKRLYLLINVITPKGRQISSNHFLIDRIIQEFAGTNLQLDFEGSEIPGVQDFFKNFHPFNQPYFHVHYNHLRWPLRVIKK